MLNSNDIYSHLLNGGDKQTLYDALTQEIFEAEAKVKATKEAEKKQKELDNKKNKARVAAFLALKDYFALVNEDIDEDIINSILDTLEKVEIKVNGIRGKRKDYVTRDGSLDITDEEWREIWNTVFPFHFKIK
jgi:uncharacterized protein YcaQ